MSRIVMWWSTDGWSWREAPAQWEHVIANSDTDTDWDHCMGKEYSQLFRIGSVDGEYYDDNAQITIYATKGDAPHLYIEVLAFDALLCEFFVAERDRAPFIVDKLPALLQAFPPHNDDLNKIRRALTAWIRHGRGEHVVDPEAIETLDERRERLEQKHAREAWKAKQKAAADVLCREGS